MIRLLALFAFINIVACDPKKSENGSLGVENPDMDQDLGSGGRVGNGGSGVLCRTDDGKVKSIELFDFYEARALDPTLNFALDFTPVAGAPIDQAIETARFVIESRVRTFDLALADYLQWRLDQFKAETLISQAPLPATNDIEPMRTMEGRCRKIQLAFTREPDLLSSKKFHIWRTAFEHPAFSNTNRAALLLHELFYELAALRGAENSRGTRAMVATIFSGQYLDKFATRADYFLFANAAKMPWAGFGRLPVKLDDSDSSFSFWEDQTTLKDGFILPGDLVETPIGRLRIGCWTSFSKEGTPQAFSHAWGETNESAHRVQISTSDGFTDTFAIPTQIMVPYTPLGVSTWNANYHRTRCPVTGRYSVIIDESLDYKYFSGLDHPLPVNFQNSFFKVESSVIEDVSISMGQISGTPAKELPGEIQFNGVTESGSCKISKINLETISVSDCRVQLFKGNIFNFLSIDSIERNTEPFLTVKLSDANENLRSDRYHPQLALISNDGKYPVLLKPGTTASFDKSGFLRDGTIMDTNLNVCVSGTSSVMNILSPEGKHFRFDEKGCVIAEGHWPF